MRVEGLDTVKLRLTDYQIKPGARFTVTPGNVDLSTGEQNEVTLYDGKEVKIIGQKAFINTTRYNVTMQPKGCFVQASLPKVINGDNMLPIDRNEVKDALTIIEKDLKEDGIHTNIFSQDLSRVDIFRQSRLTSDFTNYLPVFGILNGKRQNKRDYGTSYLFHNRQRELMFYDKLKQHNLSQGVKYEGSSNLMRSECRLLNKRSVNGGGLQVANDLVKSFDLLPGVYTRGAKNVFSFDSLDVDEHVLTTNDLVMEMEFIKQLKGGFKLREVKDHIMTVGVCTILSHRSSIQNYIDAVRTVTDAKNERDLVRNVRGLLQKYSFGSLSALKDYKQLYGELYSKFVA